MTDTLHKTSQSCTMNDTPESNALHDKLDKELAFMCERDDLEAALVDMLNLARKLERERNGYYDELLTKRGLCKIQERAIDDWKAEAERWRSLAQGWKEEAVEQIKETNRLVEGIRAELMKNAHLADGDDCTLIGLKQLIGHEEGEL